ncbi:hypothetical protein V2A60_000696 [Cordyceps javanica]
MFASGKAVLLLAVLAATPTMAGECSPGEFTCGGRLGRFEKDLLYACDAAGSWTLAASCNRLCCSSSEGRAFCKC